MDLTKCVDQIHRGDALHVHHGHRDRHDHLLSLHGHHGRGHHDHLFFCVHDRHYRRQNYHQNLLGFNNGRVDCFNKYFNWKIISDNKISISNFKKGNKHVWMYYGKKLNIKNIKKIEIF